MGMFDFLKKKKKDEFLDLGTEPLSGAPSGGYGPATPGQGAPSGPGTEAYEQYPPPQEMPPQEQVAQPPQMGDLSIIKKDIETLSYKIDALKASIDALTVKITSLERERPGY